MTNIPDWADRDLSPREEHEREKATDYDYYSEGGFFDPDPDDWLCPVCGSEDTCECAPCPGCGEGNVPIGHLVHLVHYRCRACGLWYNVDIRGAEYEEDPLGPPPEDTDIPF